MTKIPMFKVLEVYEAIVAGLEASRQSNYPVWEKLDMARAIVKVYLMNESIEVEVTKEPT